MCTYINYVFNDVHLYQVSRALRPRSASVSLRTSVARRSPRHGVPSGDTSRSSTGGSLPCSDAHCCSSPKGLKLNGPPKLVPESESQPSTPEAKPSARCLARGLPRGRTSARGTPRRGAPRCGAWRGPAHAEAARAVFELCTTYTIIYSAP